MRSGSRYHICLVAIGMILGLFYCRTLSGQPGHLTVTYNRNVEGFPIVADGQAAAVFVDSNDAKVVSIAARAFCGDVAMITGTRPKLITNNERSGEDFAIIAGTIGQCSFIDELIRENFIS